MSSPQAIDRLEARLTRLIEEMLVGKKAEIDFLTGLNRLDDILLDLEQGRQVTAPMLQFMSEHRSWLDQSVLDKNQKSRLIQIMRSFSDRLSYRDDADSLKLLEEVKEWLKTFGDGAFRLTLKASREEATLADRFCSLLLRETEEINMLLAERDHLLTCLDDLLNSAENKPDSMYKHLAAALIYFLKMEGYKVDPYVKKLHEIGKKAQAG